jgi:PAS domain S-box-containing protein
LPLIPEGLAAPPGAAADKTPAAEDNLQKAAASSSAEASREAIPAAAPERTAEIYILRQSHAHQGKVVPIRPGALEPLPAPEPAAAVENVELSKGEPDAFREIARALVGRPASPRRDVGDGPDPDAAPTGDGGERPAPHELSPTDAPLRERLQEPGAELAEMRPVDAAAILDRLPLALMIVREARALYLNRTLIDLLGYRDFAHFAAADGLAGLFKGRDPEVVSGSDGVAPIPITRADGSLIAVDGRAQIVSWGGAPATLIAFRRPIEPLDSDAPPPSGASRSRRRSADELQALLDHATDGAVTLDPAARIVSLNEPAERLFGYGEMEVVGESVLMLMQPQSHPEMTARLDILSRADSAASLSSPFPIVGRDRAGQTLPLALTLVRIGPGEAPHFGALVRDLSREREAERSLMAARDAALAASAAKTDFLAQVSHEVRTPLHAILGFAEVMIDERFGPAGNERYKDYLKDIHASGKHVMSLADDLLDLSKIEAGKFELAFTVVDVNALIRECISLMQPEATRERVIMRVSLFEHLPRVMADERSLRQIMLNLISNAVKFNGPGGQVIVSTALDPIGQAVIRVRDTGVGMSESEIEVALEPFGRIASAARKGGAGLGLPLTKALVEANGAEFSIKSRREHGTLIEIAFPVAKAAE